jgi:antitoxin MazE
MHAKIRKWGNSLAIRIPRGFARDTGLDDGARVDISLREGAIVVQPEDDRLYCFAEMLKSITNRNLHAVVDTGRPVGKENVR